MCTLYSVELLASTFHLILNSESEFQLWKNMKVKVDFLQD